jgi:polyhydroxyalkanoate synthase
MATRRTTSSTSTKQSSAKSADDGTSAAFCGDPSGALGGGDVAAGMDPMNMLDAARDLVNPVGLVGELPKLTAELGKILLGTSEVEPAPRDKRFADSAWKDNPVYRRWAQTYVAWSGTVERLANNPELSDDRRERANYLARVITGVAAPTNTPVGNPAVLKRAFETGGASLVRGARNLLHDVTENGGMPASVDASPYTVGENVACTPGAVVHREEMFEILQYEPSTKQVGARPTLMIPPQINKHYFLDLAPGRSLVEYTVAQGVQFFTIVWRNPREDHGHWSLDDYVAAQIRAIDVVLEITGSPDLNVLGACAGGLTSALMLAHLAANGDQRVHAASFMITMIDTRHQNLLRSMATSRLRAQLAKDAAEGKVYDSASLSKNFAWMRPNDLVFNYVVNNWMMGEKPPSFDILAWNADATNLSATFDRDLLGLYGENLAAQPGALTVLGTPIDLSKVDRDAFIVCGKTDHITPWAPCYMTSQLLGGDCEMVVTSTGHIQTIVNPPGKARAAYWTGAPTESDPERWLANAEPVEGSWWPKWAEWITAHSGKQVAAPRKLGSRKHAATDPAPGRYVMEH